MEVTGGASLELGSEEAQSKEREPGGVGGKGRACSLESERLAPPSSGPSRLGF